MMKLSHKIKEILEKIDSKYKIKEKKEKIMKLNHKIKEILEKIDSKYKIKEKKEKINVAYTHATTNLMDELKSGKGYSIGLPFLRSINYYLTKDRPKWYA